MTILVMGCTTSIHDQTESSRNKVELHPIIKSYNGDAGHRSKPSSSLKRSRVAPFPVNDPSDNCEAGGRVSPTLSDNTETNKSVKRVAFTDNPQSEHGSQATVTKITFVNGGGIVPIVSSPTDLRHARKKRERNLRRRLLSKLGEAETLSERLLQESERLSLTSSMSRATSRTGSFSMTDCDRDGSVTDAADYRPADKDAAKNKEHSGSL
ncbi:uncharacterized protein [Watersipora subatra]|uniref:uncharacterized protein n=1 Tax=Watersipora subatra TaxID=2589382 RepID=UPI00355B6163